MLRVRKSMYPGNMLIMTLILVSLLFVGATLAVTLVADQSRLTSQQYIKEQALHIAEAGIEFYRWHLAHVPDDFVSDTGLHEYRNSFGELIGYFNIAVTPPSTGSTVVTLTSTGYTTKKESVKRTISVQLGIPSFAQFAVVANDFMRFGVGTEVYGPIHSNGGIRFDGIAHNIVSSAKETFTDPDTSQVEDGVYTTQADESLVFLAGKSFPVTQIDFNGITSDLQTLKTKAQTGGVYLPPSAAQGYHVTFRADDMIDIRIVNTQLRCQYRQGSQWRDFGFCSNDYNRSCYQNSNCTGGGTCVFSNFSVGSRVSDQSTFTYQGGSSLGVAIPANGVIFIEDDVWVDGIIDTARATLVAAREPLASGNARIFINNDLKYTHYDGSDVLGLIAQQDILTGYFSEDDIRIDAALIAQKGRVGRPYYGINATTWRLFPTGSPDPSGESSCANYRKRTQITTYGALGTNLRYGFAWVGNLLSCGGGQTNQSGYCTRNLNFDSALLYAPPPSFPTTGQYTLLSWEED